MGDYRHARPRYQRAVVFAAFAAHLVKLADDEEYGNFDLRQTRRNVHIF